MLLDRLLPFLTGVAAAALIGAALLLATSCTARVTVPALPSLPDAPPPYPHPGHISEYRTLAVMDLTGHRR